MSNSDYQGSVHVNLAGLGNLLHMQLQRISLNVAAGLSVAPTLSEGSFKLPETGIVLFPIHGPASNVEDARSAFADWIVANGIRDSMEAVSSFLEGIRNVLALWSLSVTQSEKGSLSAEDWNVAMNEHSLRFHKLGLPHKLDHLREHYKFKIEPSADVQIRSVNAARNCIVHRGGIVSPVDVDESGALVVRLIRHGVFVSSNEGESEASFPVAVPAGGEVRLRNVALVRTFQVGERVRFDLADFSALNWTLFVFGSVTTKSMEKHGRDMGLTFTTSASNSN